MKKTYWDFIGEVEKEIIRPTPKKIQVKVQRENIEMTLSLTEDEAMTLMKDIAKNLDPKKVYKAIGNIVVRG